MLKPPSPQSAITWRERSSAWMPLAWPRAVPTAPLLKEPMIRCSPLWRIQLPDQSGDRIDCTDDPGRAVHHDALGGDFLTVDRLFQRRFDLATPTLGFDTRLAKDL